MISALLSITEGAEGYVLPREVLHAKIEETLALGGNPILLQGGLHPHFKLEWYEEMLSDIKSRFQSLTFAGFSPPEIHHFTKVNKLPLREVLERLKLAGLGSLPGGGAEILVDRVRHGDHSRQGTHRRLVECDAGLA